MTPLQLQEVISNIIQKHNIRISVLTATIDKANKILFKIKHLQSQQAKTDLIITSVLQKYGKYGPLTISMLMNTLLNYRGSANNVDMVCPKTDMRIVTFDEPFWSYTDIHCPCSKKYYINQPTTQLIATYPNYIRLYIQLYESQESQSNGMPFYFCEHVVKNSICLPLAKTGKVSYYKSIHHYFESLYEFVYALSQYLDDYIIYTSQFYIIIRTLQNTPIMYIASEQAENLENLYTASIDLNKTWIANHVFTTNDLFILNDIVLTTEVYCITAHSIWIMA